MTKQLQMLRLRARRNLTTFYQLYHPRFWKWIREAEGVLADFKGNIVARSRYGVRISLDLPDDLAYASVYAVGVYETGTTDLLRTAFRSNDVFLDIGANIGWYSLHFARFVPGGQCHAFEPMPLALQKLKRNISLNRMNEAITVQPVALGDKPGKAELYSFSGLPHLHSSLSRQGREDATGQEVTVMTLDDAIGSGVVPNPDIIKIDVEGYELQVLHGAIELLKNSTPIWLFEMNEETSAAFHYSPVDLLHHICSHAPYKFIRIPSAWGRAQPMHFARDYQHGDNVVCYIHEKHSERLRNVLRPFTVG